MTITAKAVTLLGDAFSAAHKCDSQWHGQENEGYFLPVWPQEMLSFIYQQTSSQSCLGIFTCSVGLLQTYPGKLSLYSGRRDPSSVLHPCYVLFPLWAAFHFLEQNNKTSLLLKPGPQTSHFALPADVWAPDSTSDSWLSYPQIASCQATQSWPNASSQLWAPVPAGWTACWFAQRFSCPRFYFLTRTGFSPTLYLGKDYSPRCEDVDGKGWSRNHFHGPVGGMQWIPPTGNAVGDDLGRRWSHKEKPTDAI